MADVFISYKRRLRPRVVELASALEGLGLSVWFDAELEAGRSFAAVINGELAKARSVIVCWTEDAFAPEDGSEVSWVEAEATVAQERKVIVPVLFERVTLKAPWNMLHTERLMDWRPGLNNHPGWLGVVEAVGRLTGRPGLADGLRAREATAPASLAERVRRALGRVPAAMRWLGGATLFNTIASVLLMLRVGPNAQGVASYVMLAGPIVAATILAFALWRARVLDPGRALFTVAASLVGYVAAAFTAALVEPLMAVFGTEADVARGFINGSLAGFTGCAIALAGIGLLVGDLKREDWLRIGLGSVGLGLVCGLLGTGLLRFIYDSNFFWISVTWTFAYGALLSWIFTPRARGS